MSKVIDIHVHIGGPGDSGSGCSMSPQFIISPAFGFMLASLGATPCDVTDAGIRKIIEGAVNGATKVEATVLLALDGVYRKNGKACPAESHLLVPNQYVVSIAQANPRVLLGASVHPYRAKWRQEAEYCLANRAVLFKWIPSSQQVDPADDACLPFYRLLAAENIPLLCHTGPEHAVPTSQDGARKYNDPRRLRKALNAGVKVIAAHCATPYFGDLLDPGYFEELLALMKTYPSLYADLSAFCVPTRIGYLEKVLTGFNKGRLNPDQFLFGSDFPIPIMDINLCRLPLDPAAMLSHLSPKANPLDHNYEILKEFGLPDRIFTNAERVLRM